jgi:hypothetical protein
MPGGEFGLLDMQDPAVWNERTILEDEDLLLLQSALSLIGRCQLEDALQSARVCRRRTLHGIGSVDAAQGL